MLMEEKKKASTNTVKRAVCGQVGMLMVRRNTKVSILTVSQMLVHRIR